MRLCKRAYRRHIWCASSEQAFNPTASPCFHSREMSTAQYARSLTVRACHILLPHRKVYQMYHQCRYLDNQRHGIVILFVMVTIPTAYFSALSSSSALPAKQYFIPSIHISFISSRLCSLRLFCTISSGNAVALLYRSCNNLPRLNGVIHVRRSGIVMRLLRAAACATIAVR